MPRYVKIDLRTFRRIQKFSGLCLLGVQSKSIFSMYDKRLAYSFTEKNITNEHSRANSYFL